MCRQSHTSFSRSLGGFQESGSSDAGRELGGAQVLDSPHALAGGVQQMSGDRGLELVRRATVLNILPSWITAYSKGCRMAIASRRCR
jgi:hypothetical protein